MGDKLEAKRLAGAVGVPVLPGIEVTDLDGDALRAVADEIGWPVLVKAAFGGGGVGMRLLREPGELAEAVAAARRLAAAAVAVGQAIGYVGAGTVEFLLTPDGEFLFLEVNTRLQVEHPVTEAVT